MDREEILAKSRAENQNRDMYEQEVLRQAGVWAARVMVLLATVFFAAQIFAGGGTNWGLWALVFSANMTVFWVKYRKLRQRHELLLAIAYTLAVAGFSAAYIYELAA